MAKRKTGQKEQPKPTCSCLLLCDDVIISYAKDKHILQGVIGGFSVTKLPSVTGGFVVYLRLSNVHQNQTVIVKFKPAKDEVDDKGLWELEAELIQQDPLAVCTLIARVPPFAVAESGRYILSAEHGGIPLASIPITVHNQELDQENAQ